MNIVGMMRIKNEDRWIERVLRSMVSVCDHIYIMDDHSTDRTREICQSFRQVTLFDSPFEGTQETRDKNWLLERIEVVVPRFVLAIDGDEELVAGSAEEIFKISKGTSGPDAFQFRVLYLWNGEQQVRTDGVYGHFFRPSMFRLRKGARFVSADGGGFHCGNVPNPQNVARSNVKLLHYGYMHKEDRLRKYDWYNAPDKQPIPPIEDGYKHMVVGDVFPAQSAFRWAGPLELRSLDNVLA